MNKKELTNALKDEIKNCDNEIAKWKNQLEQATKELEKWQRQRDAAVTLSIRLEQEIALGLPRGG